MATNLGRIGFVPKGNWVAGTYKFLDVVRYNGGTYACQVVSTVNNPSNATDWMLLNSDGTQGIQGIAGQVFSYVGTWAGKPTSLTNAYTDRVFITDIGVGGSEWYWDGTRYRVVGGQVILKNKKETENLSITMSSASAFIDYNYSIPANLLKTGDIVELQSVISTTSTPIPDYCAVESRMSDSNGDFIFGRSAISMLPITLDGRVNSTRISLLSGFKVNSDTLLSAITTGRSGYGGGESLPTYKNATVQSISSTNHALKAYIYCSGSTAATVSIDHLLITLKTCG